MADLENRVEKLETRVSAIESKVDVLVAKMDMFIGEMRDRDNQRAAEIARVDAKIEALHEQREKDNAKLDATTIELRKEISDGIKTLQNLTIAAIVGIGAISVGVLAFIGFNIYRASETPQYQAPPPAQTQTVQTISE
ncbi:MAG: hypothetical protein J5809_07260 [Selenomonadaceae bacterium]|nr:hypothetical protein [Selenomonadaceae bacterium]